MPVQLPASNQELDQTKREQIFIGLISIPVLTAVFASRFALLQMRSFLRKEQIYKRQADVDQAELLLRGSENPLYSELCLDG